MRTVQARPRGTLATTVLLTRADRRCHADVVILIKASTSVYIFGYFFFPFFFFFFFFSFGGFGDFVSPLPRGTMVRSCFHASGHVCLIALTREHY